MGFSLIPTGTNIINDERSHAYEVTIQVCALVFEGFVHAGSVFQCGCAAAAPNTVNSNTKCAESSGSAGELLRIWANFSDQLYH